jgi:hypothetical protein
VASSPSPSHLGAGLQRRRDKTSGVVNAAGVRAPLAARTRRGRIAPASSVRPPQPPRTSESATGRDGRPPPRRAQRPSSVARQRANRRGCPYP